MPSTALIPPILLYIACALGALAVVIAMPRKKAAAYVIGAAVGAGALVVAMLGMAKASGGAGLPGPLFYAFAAIALAASLRVITHPRPIYSALYFILTIVASTGLYVMLGAEFMSFALIIIYAGAILITYMFVIMLASEGATENATEGQAEYDRVGREPVVATFAGFVLLAALCSILLTGNRSVAELPRAHTRGGGEVMFMSERVETSLKKAGLMKEGEKLAALGEQGATLYERGFVSVLDASGKPRDIPREKLPADLGLSNTEAIGFDLMERHPGSIEIAGVILLMAMLGAVVLARKKVEMDDQAKAIAAKRAAEDADTLGADGNFAQPAVGGNQ